MKANKLGNKTDWTTVKNRR